MKFIIISMFFFLLLSLSGSRPSRPNDFKSLYDYTTDEIIDALIYESIDYLEKFEKGLTKDEAFEEARNVKKIRETIETQKFAEDVKKVVNFATDPKYVKYLEGKAEKLVTEENENEFASMNYLNTMINVLKELKKSFMIDGLEDEATEAEQNIHIVIHQIKPTFLSVLNYIEKYGDKYDV